MDGPGRVSDASLNPDLPIIAPLKLRPADHAVTSRFHFIEGPAMHDGEGGPVNKVCGDHTSMGDHERTL